MIKVTVFQKIAVAFILLSGLLSVYSCDEAGAIKDTVDDVIEDVNGLATTDADSARFFLTAWLADCVNDTSLTDNSPKTIEYLEAIAAHRIRSAYKNDTITNPLGVQELVWGPVVELEESKGLYTASNTLFCTKYTDGNGDLHFSVGIAGTDMISYYDWFTEDFQTDSLVAGFAAGEEIAYGTAIGAKKLYQMTDTSAVGNVELLVYLKSQVDNNPGKKVTIGVAGHSLGGALTQVYSYYLREKLTDSNVNVQAWVYAGPTAGNDVFANNLVRKVAYTAYNNSMDAIPHVWQADRLNELCNLYTDGYSPCPESPITNTPIINGIVKYLKDVSAAGNYTVPPGNSHTFTGRNYRLTGKEKIPGTKHDSIANCISLQAFIDALEVHSEFNTIGKYMREIYSSCTTGSSKTININDYTSTIYFLLEMGYQHTSAYVDHFFKTDAVKKAVNRYVTNPSNDFTAVLKGAQGGYILSEFLELAAKHKPTNCDCTAPAG